jgi:4-amino-4-deoxy-L-arabinose transferase-like glycosyltransferase
MPFTGAIPSSSWGKERVYLSTRETSFFSKGKERRPRLAADRSRLLLVLALSAVSVVAFQGSRGLYDHTEGRYAEIAREMIASGDYLEPTLDHVPHWAKPPLTYWAIAAGVRVLGRNAWGARFYDVFAFVITVLAVTVCARALWDGTTGFVAGLVYLSSFLPAAGANLATTDTLLAMWEALGVLFYVLAYRSPDRGRSRTWVRLMWLAFGLGFFTKGPPALLPLLALVAFHLHARRPFALGDILGFLLFAASALSP